MTHWSSGCHGGSQLASQHNLRLFRQTYYGICDLLHPLVREGLACVLPMQSLSPDRPWMLEVCPASTLKREGLYLPYKGRVERHRTARMRVLKALEEMEVLTIPQRAARSAILENHGGDALDSVIAALATFKALRDPAFPAVESNDAYALEG